MVKSLRSIVVSVLTNLVVLGVTSVSYLSAIAGNCTQKPDWVACPTTQKRCFAKTKNGKITACVPQGANNFIRYAYSGYFDCQKGTPKESCNFTKYPISSLCWAEFKKCKLTLSHNACEGSSMITGKSRRVFTSLPCKP